MSLSAQQIVTDALTLAKVPGYTALGGRQLNLVLQDLVLNRNLKINLQKATITLSAGSYGPFNLESDYLRTFDLFFYIDGNPFFLTPGDLRQYDQEPLLSGTSSWPFEYATDLSAKATGGVGQLYVYPQAGTTISLTHRYYNQQADIATPETSSTVPWFPDQDYLIHATATRLMKYSDDDRYGEYIAIGEQKLLKHLMMEGDEQEIVKEVKLDPRRFRINGSSKPTKTDPW